jgi:hypothetical protein
MSDVIVLTVGVVVVISFRLVSNHQLVVYGVVACLLSLVGAVVYIYGKIGSQFQFYLTTARKKLVRERNEKKNMNCLFVFLFFFVLSSFFYRHLHCWVLAHYFLWQELS